MDWEDKEIVIRVTGHVENARMVHVFGEKTRMNMGSFSVKKSLSVEIHTFQMASFGDHKKFQIDVQW